MSKELVEFSVTPEKRDTVVSVYEDLSKLLEGSEVEYTPKPIDRIKITLYSGDEIKDCFSLSVTSKSRLCRALVAVVGKVISVRRRRLANR